MDLLILFVNGLKVVIENPDPETSLLQYLRNELQLKGTKLGCGEGGCGACTVMVTRYDSEKKAKKHFTINSCLTSLCSLHGMAVTTVEGVGSQKNGLHPVQERIASYHGSQCGFCTPGIVMSVYTLFSRDPNPSESDVENALEGNLCRCTGYRPILEGLRTLTQWQNGFTESSLNGFGLHSEDEQPSNESEGTKTKSGCLGDHCTNGGICCDRTSTYSNKIQKVSSSYFCTQKSSPKDLATNLKSLNDELKLINEVCDRQQLVFKSERVTWYRPTTLDDLIHLKDKYPTAKILVGNTEIGIELKFKNKYYPVIIAATHIAELRSIQQTETGIQFGASVILDQLDDVLKKAILEMDECRTRVFAAIVEMLRWFAGPQIRNVASLGGNIITASPISDLNPLFMSARCTLTVASRSGGKRTLEMDGEFFTDYRQTNIKPDEVLLSVEIPFTQENEYFHGYKQAQRKVDDIAIVNAGMKVVFEEDSNVIRDITLCYGGMAAVTVMATKTANQLIGRKWDDSLISTASQLLAEEFHLLPGCPGGMEAYRCCLTASFFYKFYVTVRLALQTKLSIYSESVLPKEYASASIPYNRQPNRGVQVYEDTPTGQINVDAIGRPMMHVSALQQVTGEAIFIDDMPKLKGEYYMSLVVSKKAHAKLLRVDPSDALRMPGVVDYISWKDVPGQNKVGCIVEDETVFAVDMVTCQGMVIGGVLADNQLHAERAAKAVRVIYEELKPIITTEEAIAASSFLMPPRTLKNGDVVDAMVSSEHTMEGEMRIGGQEHFYLETHAALAVPKDGNGELEVFSSCQNPSLLQNAIAKVLDVSCNKITVRVKRLGGGFGGKETRFLMVVLPVAVAANKHKRPVRCVLDRNEDMMMTGTRHPYLVKYKVGFSSKGKVKAVDLNLFQNSGNTHDLSSNVLDRTLFHVDNAYKIPNIRATGFLCRTNIPSNTAFRGFGGPQAMLISENIMTDIAKTLNISPLKVRELNMYKEGETTHYNQAVLNSNLRRCWDEVIQQSDFENRKLLIDDFNSKSRWLKRGIAVIPVKFGVAFGFLPLNQGGALVHIYLDGSVLISLSFVEMGQGINTKIIQVASRVLKIPTSKIYIGECNTSHVPNASPSAGSMGSDINGMAVMYACQALMNRLEPYMTSNPKGPWETWITNAYLDRVSLSATGFYKIPDLDYDYETNTGRKFSYFSTGAACSEVEIDCLTGDHTVMRTDIVMDVGKSLNPAIDIGQIEGGFMQGYGLYTIEEQKYSPNGSLLTTGPGTYKIPCVANIPVEFNVTLLKDAPNPRAVYSSKAVGEPPLFLSSSVFFAIKEAIEAARKEVGLQGPFRMDSPASAERIRMACVDDFTRQQLESKSEAYTPWSVAL